MAVSTAELPLVKPRTRSRWLQGTPAALLIALTAVYLFPFVRRSWIPADEGTFALTALRALGGEWPHVDFDDLYTGGQTWMYAAVFAVFGVDLVWIRFAIFVCALVAVATWYLIARRYASPAAAAAIAFTGLLWSFPNFFAGHPSWWNLLFASIGAMMLFRYDDTRRSRNLVAAGVMFGLGIAFKQTGVYLLGAATLWLALEEQWDAALGRTGDAVCRRSVVIRGLLAVAAVVTTAVIIGRIKPAEFVVLFGPVAALASLPVFDELRRTGDDAARVRTLARRLGIFLGAAALPLLPLVLPYVLAGRFTEFLDGVFLLPLRRYAFTVHHLPSLWLSLGLVPFAGLLVRRLTNGRSETWSWHALVWAFAAAMAVAYHTIAGYQVAWNAIRNSSAIAAYVAAIAIWRHCDDRRAKDWYLLTALAAFMALFQLPYPYPFYFAYAAPLVFLSFFALAYSQRLYRPATWAPLVIGLIAFAMLSLNRGSVRNFGLVHMERQFDAELALPRAHLQVTHEEADLYRRLIGLLRTKARGRNVHAFPDSPEIAFIAGYRPLTRTTYDFFRLPTVPEVSRLWRDRNVGVIVINHGPSISEAMLTPALLRSARATFPEYENIGRFEVRWN